MERPQDLRERPKDSENVTVWRGMSVNQEIGPYYFVSFTVIGASYKHFLTGFFLQMPLTLPSDTYFSRTEHHYISVWKWASFEMRNYQIHGLQEDVFSHAHRTL